MCRAELSNSTITLQDGDILTCTLADGSTFALVGNLNLGTPELTLTAATLPAADLNPIVINAPVVSGPSGLRAGQMLTVQPGGVLRDNFAVVGATLNVDGGIVGNIAEAFDSVVNISAGTIGYVFRAYNSELNISGGTIGDAFNARSSVLNISGGTLESPFRAFDSEVNITGTEFFIDGLGLDNLQPGEAFTVTNRDVTLSGLLADGEPFSIDLNSATQAGMDFFDPGTTITVTLDAPAADVILGDVNQDGVVSFMDIAAFISVLAAAIFLEEADCNLDGEVNFLDIQSFVAILSGG